ncbi:MAG: hypothetical protein EHM35_16180 [Planctomycetaceae bacterium]|nr:MAG: hypothetical protein EHM35_16180 [Planctomycetaceae bacterium]
MTVLPYSLISLLQEHLQRVKALHEQDLAQGYGAVYLPIGLRLSYYTDDEGRCVARFPVPVRHRTGRPRPEHQGTISS